MAENSNIFDILLLLKDDPKAFEEERKKILAKEFAKFTEERRKKAEQQQWIIEGELRNFKDPKARYNKMIELFWKQFAEFHTALQSINKVIK